MWILVTRLIGAFGGRVAIYGGIAILALLAGIYAKYFSASARLVKLEKKAAVVEAVVREEAVGLLADYARIAAEPHQTGQDLADQLTASIKRLHATKTTPH